MEVRRQRIETPVDGALTSELSGRAGRRRLCMRVVRPRLGIAGCFLGRLRSCDIFLAILQNSSRAASLQEAQTQPKHQYVIQLADHRNEIRNQLDRACDIGDRASTNSLRIPGHTGMNQGAPQRAKLLPQLTRGSFQLPGQTLSYWLRAGWHVGRSPNLLCVLDQVNLSL